MTGEELNEQEQSALIEFYGGVSVLAMAAKTAGDALTLEVARTMLATIEAGCQATAVALRQANPAAYPPKAPAVEKEQDADAASVIELDAYRKSGGYLN